MGCSRDIHNNLKITEVLAAAAPGISDEPTSEVDTQGYDSLEISVSSVASAAGTVKLQESDTSGSGYTDCAAGDVLGTQGTALVNGTAVKLGYVGSKRYVIALVSVTTDGVISANAVQGYAHEATVN